MREHDFNQILKHPKLGSLRVTFWSKVRVLGEDDCWEWQAALDPAGYGQAWMGGMQGKAHRFAYLLNKGPLPKASAGKRTCVLHSCDNRKCTNPKHLSIGDDAKNAAEAVTRKRTLRGSAHYAARLTWGKVDAIRADKSRSLRSWAEEFGVSPATVGYARLGKTWRRH